MRQIPKVEFATPSPCWQRRAAGLLLGLLVLNACKAGQFEAPTIVAQDARPVPSHREQQRMWMIIGKERFAVTLADTAAARAFAAQLPISMEMADLNGNEKHADLARSLPTDASRPGTIRNGDLMLYGDNTVVIFYETFRSSYSYTRLGRVDDASGLAQSLGTRSVQVRFSAE